MEKFFEKFYGANWRNGNSDGSRYIVEHSFSQILTPEMLKEYSITEDFKWNFQNDEKNHNTPVLQRQYRTRKENLLLIITIVLLALNGSFIFYLTK